MVYMLDVRKLRMLAELDRLGTVAAVARALHLTAPGVSMQLGALEREVGVALTERNGRMLILTAAGRLLAQHGRDVVDRLSVAQMEVEALADGTAGTYRVAAFPSIARTIVADTWRAIRAEPATDIRLELIEMEPQDSLPALAGGAVDVAITHAYSNMSQQATAGFAASALATETVWLAVRDDEPLAGPDPVDLRLFADHDWVIPHRQWACHEMVQRACGMAGFTPHSVAEATDFAVILALVSAGVGVALVPELTIADLPGNVRLLPLSEPVFRHDFVVTRRATDADPGIRRLRSLFAESAALRTPRRVFP